jgi:excisionase family DNA binding protein
MVRENEDDRFQKLKASPPGDLIDVEEFAATMKCSTKHIRRLVDAGKCPPPLRLGSLLRWRRDVVDEWTREGCPSVRTLRVGGGK